MSNKVKIIDLSTETILYEYSIEDNDKAFHKANELENMGLNVKILTPTSIETLGVALGADHQSLKNVSQEIEKEIDSHL